jgi:hypothetical protein
MPHYGSMTGVVKCGRLFMASQSGAERGIHSSGSLSTRSTSLARFRHVQPRTRCRRVLPGADPFRLDISASLY